MARAGERGLIRTAERQLGLLTRGQVRAAGVPSRTMDRRVAEGQWVRVLPGIYRVPGSPSSFEQRLLAACMWAGDGAVASHRAAAALWRLAGVPGGLLDITTGRRVRGQGVIVHTRSIRRGERTKIGPIPITSVARTLLDLGAVLPRALPSAMDDALRRELVTPARLRAIVEASGGSGNRGVAPLREALRERAGASGLPESLLEVRLLRALRRTGLPAPVLQHPVRDGSRRIIARVDMAYPEIRLAIEADGFRFHGGLADWRRDVARGNRLSTAGWTVFRVTWHDLESPRDVVRQVKGFFPPKTAKSGA